MDAAESRRRSRNFRGYTHEQELDLIELGEKAARCIKGENGPRGQAIVSGRAARGVGRSRRQRLLGPQKSNWWNQKPAALKSVLEEELERLRRREKAYQLSLREVDAQAQERHKRDLRRIAELEQEVAHLSSSLQVIEKVAHRAQNRGAVTR